MTRTEEVRQRLKELKSSPRKVRSNAAKRHSLHRLDRPTGGKYLVTCFYGRYTRGTECDTLRDVLAVVNYEIPHGANQVIITELSRPIADLSHADTTLKQQENSNGE